MIPNNNGFISSSGHFSRLGYENPNTYKEKVMESTSPLKYKLCPNQIYNKDRCFSLYGPRLDHMGYGDSIPETNMYATAQSLIDVDTVFSNRNVKISKNRLGKVNPINPVNELKVQNATICNNKLDPQYSLDEYPKSNYRGMETNRFYNLLHDPQENIFWNFAINSQLEAIDNFVPSIPKLWNDETQPTPEPNYYKPCVTSCGNVPKMPSQSWNGMEMRNSSYYQPNVRDTGPFYQQKQNLYNEFAE